MKILACDIGSTNLKLQVFSFDCSTSLADPAGEPQLVHHGQDWLLSRLPLDSLSEWLSRALALIVPVQSSQIDAIGFSTFREALVGLSAAGQVVFAGTNLQARPIGNLDDARTVTTLAGWFAWKITGQCCITDGQRTAGNAYIGRVAPSPARWCTLVPASQNMQIGEASQPAIYLGGTDEQLGYLGAGLCDSDGPMLVIATGTFWSVSCIATGSVKRGVRRTAASFPCPSVDSCVFYKWGPMIQLMSEGLVASADNDCVVDRYFGHAASLWLSNNVSVDVARRAVINDLKAACATLSPDRKARVVVHGGGSRRAYVRDLLHEACAGAYISYLDSDATLLGCAIAGGRFLYAN